MKLNWEVNYLPNRTPTAMSFLHLSQKSLWILLNCSESGGWNDNPQLNEQIIAITEKILEYECITTNQQQNIISAFH